MHFRNKVCVVIGAAGGIGSALSTELRARGARVIPVVRPSRRAQGDGALSVDMQDPAAIRKLTSSLGSEFARIDYVFNASGIAAVKPLPAMTARHIDTVLRTNLYGAMILTQRCIPLMRKHGYIVHIGSMAGIAPGHKFFAVYAASKEGLAGFLRSLKVEFPDLSFVLVTPTGVDTNIAARAIGARYLMKKLSQSVLDSAQAIAKGTLDQLAVPRRDIRLFPTRKSREVYASILP